MPERPYVSDEEYSMRKDLGQVLVYSEEAQAWVWVDKDTLK